MLKNAFHAVEQRFEEVVCSFCLALMASCVMLQVVLRYFFSAASAWAEEIAVYSMVFAVYLGASMAIRERAHIRIVFGVMALPRSLAVASIVLADLLWFGFLLLMIWQSSIYMELLFEMTFISPGLGIEQKWFQIVVPFSLVLMVLRMIQVYYRWLSGDEKGPPL
jgi:C4-dicarboxylate transporter, DctQ subunit